MKDKKEVFAKVKGKLIVSCQALPEEPLHSSYIMGRMAHAAALGGASGIRANDVSDIREIKKNVDLPIIGIIKSVYDNSDVYITPTMKEIDALYKEGVEIIALDATKRIRPDGKTISEVFPEIRKKYKDQIFMADCSTFEEADEAYKLGFDCLGTTLRGYTEYTKSEKIPDLELLEKLVKSFPIPVIAEGGIWTVEDLQNVYKLGVYTAVVGSAITRPMEITKRFVNAIKE
ncbi:N-acetylmannosamine-6-phosphate 2-epimerase [Tissierella creatinophila]|uniref:Putative N-acetylmannosamine-6-phosphate 2-epimerase n=1 Tax=Tissierella creatinophila DSM 6911 TaxID=1123403 RepID=A0A1U7M2D0_TISCR|nr:N-acetylmannosamine-6-phosphate 2-epimerase [Tissierella creatinophila]OLS01467.1 putative N-acetylmannosamine-6-phosphate 2-epimerase [Tissierella creatinophila DSM 6911]